MSSFTTKEESPTVAIETHGCKLNQADSSALMSDFLRAGFRLVSNDEPAEIYLVNTCTVTHVADRKGRQALRAARRMNPYATIVATGCYAQRSPEELRDLPEIDLVAGNTEKVDLVRQLMRYRGESNSPCTTGIIPANSRDRNVRSRAMVKIQEGCDQICAYCIVPKVRGREKSVPPDRILNMIKDHVSRGYKEVVLTGTQLGTYGFDLSDIDLKTLIERILAETRLARLRISSLQPQEIDAEFLSLWSDSRLCPHFHLALQSGSEAVLRRMRRHYTARQYLQTVDVIRASVKGASITADVIVGFPGETDEEFQQTYALCDKVGFAALHVFPYSVRPGTSAAYYRERVDPMVKSSRVREMLSLSQRSSISFLSQWLGSTREVLWESPKAGAEFGIWKGLTDNYIRVQSNSSRVLTNEITLAKLLRLEGDLAIANVLD